MKLHVKGKSLNATVKKSRGSHVLGILATAGIFFLSTCTPLSGRERAADAAGDGDRTTYGTTALPFWNGLTDFEILALRGVDEARLGDPDALFALALFASGDVRDMSIYAAYRSRVLSFVNEVRPKIGKAASGFERGKVLFDECCLTFFKHRGDADELKGYEPAQSRLSEVLRTGKFNCISSSLLYIVLARYFGLRVKGVNIPSHAFVQLETGEGQTIEIETTSRSGYNLAHNAKSFDKLKNGWFKARGLQMPTYDDYLHRQILEPFEMVVSNMNNQHTSVDRMAERDRNRLCEAMGYCCPENRAYEYARLIAYNNEVRYLHNSGDIAAMQRFYAKILPIVSTIKNQAAPDTMFFDLISVLELEHGYMLFKKNDRAPAVEELYKVVHQVSPPMKNYGLVTNNASTIVQEIVENDLRENKFAEAAALADRFLSVKRLQGHMRYLKSFIFGAWANYFWAKKDWKNTLQKLRIALASADKEDNRKLLVGNIKGAFYNAALEYYAAGKMDDVVALLKRCKTEFGLEKDAEELLQKALAAKK